MNSVKPAGLQAPVKKNTLRNIAVLVSIPVIWLAGYQLTLPSAKQYEHFERAWRDLEVIAAEPHPTESAENEEVREYIEQEIRAAGLEPLLQERDLTYREVLAIQSENLPLVNGMYEDDDRIEDGVLTIRNVYTIIPGKNPDIIAFVCHYDSCYGSPGAGDDGVSVAGVLEAMRLTAAGGTPLNTVLFLFCDAEEEILLGSRVFATEYEEISSVKFVLNFEMMGSSGVPLLFETSGGNLQSLLLYNRSAPQPYGYSFAAALYETMPSNTSDLLSFKQVGISGIGFAAVGNRDAYHSQIIPDSPENLDRNSASVMWRTITSLCSAFSNTPMDILLSEGRAVFFPYYRFAAFDEKLNIWFSLACVLLLAAVIVVTGKKGNVRFSSSIRTTLLQLLPAAAAGVMVFAVNLALPLIHVYFYRYKSYFLFFRLFSLVSALVLVALFAAFCRKHPELCGKSTLGAAVLFAALGVACCFVFPPAAYLLYLSSAALCVSNLAARFTKGRAGAFAAYLGGALLLTPLWTPAAEVLMEAIPDLAWISVMLRLLPLTLVLPLAFAHDRQAASQSA